MNAYKSNLLVVAFFALHCTFSQNNTSSTRDSIVKSAWTVGLGFNAVDDSATPFGRTFLDIKSTWNIVPFPSVLSLGRTFNNGFGLVLIGSYNRYKTGKIVDGAINAAPRNYYAIDGKINYDLNRLVGETAWFDPYLSVGGGYSKIGTLGRATANAGFGFNIWFTDRWGLNLNTMGKWGLPEGSTKQLQHVAGVVHRFGIKKDISKKGREQLALRQTLEDQQQRTKDSLDQVRRTKEAEALAAQLEREREMERLAALEQRKKDEKVLRRKNIADQIRALGAVHFDLNSSYLSQEDKKLLDKLVLILKNNPTVALKVSAHTDSRGSAKYNLWLSERRVIRTVKYLIAKGIDTTRLTHEALGETHLSNDCTDHVYCPEEKHRANRRSEFRVVGY
ncbi:OmpA family protein [Spongiimicrobium sp. 2-473A-2-J]|uniref:OmpA family protein n=1 Tax=Eudoraea algarum TaxID=3417568 RepID=UPI003D36BD5B